jgi:hypothetical protein
MCGCKGGFKGVKFSASSSKLCKDRGRKLNDAANKLAILFNITIDDPERKEQYKKDRNDINDLLKQMASTGTCPDHELVVQIANEVDNEYAKYSNT